MLEVLRAVLKAGSSEGTFRAVATAAGSLIVGERGPTMFARGAFRECLSKSKRYPLLWQHRDGEVIGIAEFTEGDEGLMVDGTLALGTRRGAEAHELLKMGALTDVSIGFTAERHHSDKHEGRAVRVVDSAQLAECSIVTWGADKEAKVRTVHARPTEDEFEGMLDAVEREAHEARAEMERHEGKVFSASNLSKLNSAIDSLFDLVSIVDPGRVAALGRKAARIMRKSLVVVSRKRRAKMHAAVRAAWLRQSETQAEIGDVPLLNLNPPWLAPGEKREAEDALQSAISSACGFPAEAKRVLVTEAVKQYLLLVEEAEPVDTDEEDYATPPDERHIKKPKAVKDGDGWKVVDEEDGHVYGSHDTKSEADAQVAALMAAKKK